MTRINQSRTGSNEASPSQTEMGSKPGINGVTLSGRGERGPATVALKVTKRRAGAAGDGMSYLSDAAARRRPAGVHAKPHRARSLGSWAGPPAGPGAEAHAQEPAHLYDLPVRARQETTCERPPERPGRLLPNPLKPLQSAGHPAVRALSATPRPSCSARPSRR